MNTALGVIIGCGLLSVVYGAWATESLLAADAPGESGRAFNVASGGSVDLLQLIAGLNQFLKLDIKPVHQPPRAGDVRTSQADITQARLHLGYEPQCTFEEGLRRSIEFYLAQAKR